MKETWRAERRFDRRPPRRIPVSTRIWFEADGPAPIWAGRIRQSIFMCRWMSRLVLVVGGVSLRRLQEISEKDARAEGAAWRISPGGDLAGAFDAVADLAGRIQYRSHFQQGWDEINGRKAGARWADNPWVWVITFKRVEAGPLLKALAEGRC